MTPKQLNPWFVEPLWQNFSSLYREAITAQDAKTGMERSHHLTASLYFGMAALEAFLNKQMRDRLKAHNSEEEEILNILRKPSVLSKIKKWPQEILGRPMPLREETLTILCDFNEIRGDLTHPKTSGHDIYTRLENIDSADVVGSVAEYIANFHEIEGTRYPYWIFGWNYLNPRSGSYEIVLINDQQFCNSLRALGLDVPSGYSAAETWKDNYLGSFDGYCKIREALNKVDRCEPKWDRVPYKPVLCSHWWLPEHHGTCGHITEQALYFARDYGK
jgi:hypothetical protein